MEEACHFTHSQILYIINLLIFKFYFIFFAYEEP